MLIIKNEVEVAQFQNSAPEYLPLSEEFWKALLSLPKTYDPSAYRMFLQLYGTHYMAEGSLGGQYQALLEFDSQFMSTMSMWLLFHHPGLGDTQISASQCRSQAQINKGFQNVVHNAVADSHEICPFIK